MEIHLLKPYLLDPLTAFASRSSATDFRLNQASPERCFALRIQSFLLIPKLIGILRTEFLMTQPLTYYDTQWCFGAFFCYRHNDLQAT